MTQLNMQKGFKSGLRWVQAAVVMVVLTSQVLPLLADDHSNAAEEQSLATDLQNEQARREAELAASAENREAEIERTLEQERQQHEQQLEQALEEDARRQEALLEQQLQ